MGPSFYALLGKPDTLSPDSLGGNIRRSFVQYRNYRKTSLLSSQYRLRATEGYMQGSVGPHE
jgi:hypothetical protein